MGLDILLGTIDSAKDAWGANDSKMPFRYEFDNRKGTVTYLDLWTVCSSRQSNRCLDGAVNLTKAGRS